MTSRTRADAGRPLAASASRTWSSRSGEVSCTAETLTDIVVSAAAGCSRRQAAAVRQASRSTQAPISPMRPRSSATGTKRLGGTAPRVGDCQRSSASKPSTRCGSGKATRTGEGDAMPLPSVLGGPAEPVQEWTTARWKDRSSVVPELFDVCTYTPFVVPARRLTTISPGFSAPLSADRPMVATKAP